MHGQQPAVVVENLTKVYGGDVLAVDDLSLEVEAGTAVGVLGPNGAGKTTAIKSLLGLVVPTGGTAEVLGIDVHDEPGRAFEHVGAMLEGARNVYWRLTVRENLEFFAAIAGNPPEAVADRQNELLAQFDLAEEAETPVRELSRGQKQKVSLAATLARDADVVFLDEPTLGLDVESTLELRAELRRLVEDEDLTILLSSHDMDVVEDVCDRVVVLDDGRILADDSVENLLDGVETRAFVVSVEEDPPERVRRRLGRTFDATEFRRENGRTRFRALVDTGEFYRFVDALRDAGLTVTSIDTADPGLEEVFIGITSSAEENPPSADLEVNSK